MSIAGRAVAAWKARIDRRWMAMHQNMRMPAPSADDAMRCGGCGAKVGAEVLAGALSSLTILPAAEQIVGLDARDDAAVLRVPPGRVLVQSVDHFRAFLDDPYVFGRIAAAHALSDIHAMGAKPWTALAVASVPYASGAKMRAELADMLRGATEILNADGCALVGGHSAEAAEASLGFAVSGLADPNRLLRKSGARAGDALILTKPLGTGIVLAAHMRGMARAGWLMAAIDAMAATNAAAAPILSAHGATACTDVTGFGLAGHLSEILTRELLAAELAQEAIPGLPGARELAAQGVASTLAPENLRALPHAMFGAPEAALLVDPQTSGGLLAAVPPDRADRCVAALRGAGVAAVVVGRIVAADGGDSIRWADG
jgi:selenide,water dikinase